MRWLRHVLVDIAVTLVVLAATAFDQRWALWLVWIYTPLLLVMRVLVLGAGGLRGLVKRPADAPPRWFVYGLMGVNAGLLLADAQWWPAAGWAFIWGLTYLADRRGL